MSIFSPLCGEDSSPDRGASSPPDAEQRDDCCPAGNVAAFIGRTKAAYVCLGSNQGDTDAHLRRAREGVAALPGVRVTAVSSIYRTEPQGMSDQPFFANQVMALACDSPITAEQLLESLLSLESSLGRTRGEGPRFGPRIIDLDLLLFGNERIAAQNLTLPHPRMLERAFALVPLAEIAPELCLPDGTSVLAALRKLCYTKAGRDIFQN